MLDILPLGDDGQIFMGMETLPPGHYETAFCFNLDEKGQCISKINLKNDSISHFRFTSSSKIFWWDDQEETFKIFWESD